MAWHGRKCAINTMEEKLSESKLYFGGMSTDHEIGLLMKEFGDMAEGTIITHDEIEHLIGISKHENRYKSVMQRLKKKLLASRNMQLHSVLRIGYKLLSPSERLGVCIDKSVLAFKTIRRAQVGVSLIPRSRLSKPEQTKADHVQIVLSKVVEQTIEARKQIAPPKKTEVNPKNQEGIATNE